MTARARSGKGLESNRARRSKRAAAAERDRETVSPLARRRGRPKTQAPELGTIDAALTDSVERQVYALLRRGMMEGSFAPGSSLTGRSIAERLGCSPTPVRDALKRLEADGVVVGRSKSAYFVFEPTREQYLEVLALRLNIEGFAAASAAKSATSDAVERIEVINERYVRASDLAETVRINFQFHFEIYRLARSQLLIDIVENLWMRIGPSMHLHAEGYDVAAVARNHRKLIEALRRNDVRAAEQAVRRDLTDAVKAIAPRLPASADRLETELLPISSLTF